MTLTKSDRSSSFAQGEMVLSVSSFNRCGDSSNRCSETSRESASAPIRCSANQPISTASPAARKVVRNTRMAVAPSTYCPRLV